MISRIHSPSSMVRENSEVVIIYPDRVDKYHTILPLSSILYHTTTLHCIVLHASSFVTQGITQLSANYSLHKIQPVRACLRRDPDSIDVALPKTGGPKVPRFSGAAGQIHLSHRKLPPSHPRDTVIVHISAVS